MLDEQLHRGVFCTGNSGIQIIPASITTISMDVDDDDNDTLSDDFDDDAQHDSARSTITSSRWPVRPMRDGSSREEEAHRAHAPFTLPRAWHRCLHGDADRRSAQCTS